MPPGLETRVFSLMTQVSKLTGIVEALIKDNQTLNEKNREQHEQLELQAMSLADLRMKLVFTMSRVKLKHPITPGMIVAADHKEDWVPVTLAQLFALEGEKFIEEMAKQLEAEADAEALRESEGASQAEGADGEPAAAPEVHRAAAPPAERRSPQPEPEETGAGAISG